MGAKTPPVKAENSVPGVGFGYAYFENSDAFLWEFSVNSTRMTTSNAHRPSGTDRQAGRQIFMVAYHA